MSSKAKGFRLALSIDIKTGFNGAYMKRRSMSRYKSRKSFKKATGVHKVNHMNPRAMRGGIRL